MFIVIIIIISIIIITMIIQLANVNALLTPSLTAIHTINAYNINYH